MTRAEARAARRAIPGDNGLPLLGHTLEFLSGRLYTDRARYDRYGPVTRVRSFGQTFVSVRGPEAVGEVFSNRDHAFANGPGWGYLIGPFFHGGLMLLDFDEHHRARRIMQEAFTSQRLDGYLAPMNATLAEGLDRWGTDRRFRIYPALKQLTLDVATKTFMGAKFGPEADRMNHAFAACVRGGTSIVRAPVPGGRWARGLAGRRLLENVLRPRIPAARAGNGTDLFSVLCHVEDDEGNRFTDDEIVDHMIFLLMAAHDTTTITMTTMAYYLAKHPDWQQRCRAESIALGAELVPYDRLDELVSLDLVMRECMRLVTAVPTVARKTVKDTSILGHPIPADTFIAVNMHGTHMLEEIWPDPERFDPERFSGARREDKVHRTAWVPFGAGVHKCIGLYFGGMQVKAAMHQLLLGHRWETISRDYTMPIDWTSLPRPRDGLPIRLTRTR